MSKKELTDCIVFQFPFAAMENGYMLVIFYLVFMWTATRSPYRVAGAPIATAAGLAGLSGCRSDKPFTGSVVLCYTIIEYKTRGKLHEYTNFWKEQVL